MCALFVLGKHKSWGKVAQWWQEWGCMRDVSQALSITSGSSARNFMPFRVVVRITTSMFVLL
jgi:hypothetical protein